MNDRRGFDPGETLLELRRFGGGFLRLALHFFEPADEPGKRVPWLDLATKKDQAAPVRAATLKPRELRALAATLAAAADRLEAEGFDLGSAPAAAHNRTERAADHFRRPKPGVRRG